MQKNDYLFIIKSFLGWRLLLFLVLFFAFKYVPLQKDFLGGGLFNYLSNPHLWALANFDGEHYLSIAQNGYLPLTYAFFPVYPYLIKLFAETFGHTLINYLFSGLLFSHLFLACALVGFYKLALIDYKKNLVRAALLILLFFPTSFYFAGVYTESLFLLLAVWAFYFMRKGNFLASGFFIAVASATKVIGILMIPALLIEFYLKSKKSFNWRDVLGLLISPLGLIYYMLYLHNAGQSPIEFFQAQTLVGETRQTSFVMLPQVIYRYIFKILPNLNYSYFPGMFSGWMEFIVSISFLTISVLSFLRIRLGYAVFLLLGFLAPTITGSFSSMPRYVLILFPAYLVMAGFIGKSRLWKFVYLGISFILLSISLALFSRGYWIS